MNKNPFVPQPSYTPQQPPLPPGPPPPQPAQPDYSAYWAAAAAQQQQQQQHQAPPVPYNPQWSAPQPAQARPTPEQNALYANYGYGGQAGLHWQQQQRQAQPGVQQPAGHYPPPPQPVAPPPQPAYNPYQPAAGYPQPYIPQAAPAQQPMAVQQPYPPPPQQQQQPQQYYPQPHPPPQHPPPPPQQQQQQQQPRNNHHLHHTPPQQLRPHKRPRFEKDAQNSRGNQFQPPSQPQFQPPPPPQGAPMFGPGQNQSHGRGGAPGQMGGGRGGPGGNRGGVGGGRGGGRGGSMSGNRGGSTGGGRGGSMFLGPGGGGAGRGGGGGGQVAPLRAHGSRGGFGNTKDYHNRRGGSFTSGGHSHQNMGNSFRGGRGQNHSSGRGGRHDGGGGGSSAFGVRDGPMASSFSSSGKKDENRRTLTDFKIVGLEMRELGWTWGILPSQPPPLSSVLAEAKEDASEGPDTSQASVKHEATEAEVSLSSEKVDEVADPENVANSSAEAASVESKSAANIATSIEVPTGPSKDAHASASTPAPSVTPPPSRIRIYFHTPVSADDSQPISLNASSSFSMGMTIPSDSRKGKRKKLEEDDGDLEEEGRGKRPPPPMGSGSQMSDNASVDMDAPGRGSVAPSVAETASEGDWLMAAIAQDDADDAQNEDGNKDGDDDKLNISHIEENNDTEVGEGDNVGNDLLVADGHGHHADNMDGQTDQDHGHEISGMESYGRAETGPNSASAAIAAAIAAAVDGSKPSNLPLDAVDPSLDVTAAESTAGAPASDGDARPIESETHNEPKDTTGSSVTLNALVLPGTAPDPAITGEEQSTNGYPDIQIPHVLVGGKPLQASASLASTVPDDDAQADETGSFDEDGVSGAIFSDLPRDKTLVGDMEAEVDLLEHEHLPEPPASPTSNTLLSTSSGSTYGEPGSQNTSTSLSGPASPAKVDGKATKTPSANRLSISYAAGSRRLVIDAGVVEKLKVFRGNGRIEVVVNIEKDGESELKGILIEGLSETTRSYAPLPTLPSDDSSAADQTIPTFTQAPIPSQIILIAHLDTDRPLSEPKWVKSGDVQEWLKSMFGRMFWVAGDAADGWERKIEVVDPDPAPTIWTILDSWSVNSSLGVQTERQRFLKTHMSSEPENILEILLRLVRGERATPFSGSSSSASISGSSISGPLLAALSGSSSSSASGGGFAHGEKQTHVSLAVLALWRMTLEYARKAAAAGAKDGESSAEEAAVVKEVEERVGEIIRCLPGHLVYKSLDGMFKEWKVEKKGGRG